MSITCVQTAALRVVVASDESQLHNLAEAWNALAGDVPFCRWEWMHCWWQHYRDAHSRLFTLLIYDEQDELVGLAPWYLDRSASRGNTVRFLGSGEVCSDYLTLLTAPEAAEPVAQRVADFLATDAHAEWDLLDFSGVAVGDRAIEALCQRLGEHAHQVHFQADTNCWRTELPDDWNEFLACLTKSRRERTRALLRRSIGSGRATMHHVTNEAELERGFQILVELHQKRRQSLSQAGCFSSRRFTEFHRQVAGRLLASGNLRLMWTELEGRPLAVQYNLVGGDTVYYYQGGFEPELASESPGWINVALSLQSAIEDGYRGYDFMRGDESYKASWQATARPLVRVRVVGRRTTARVRYASRRVCEEMKAWARQMFTRTKKGT